MSNDMNGWQPIETAPKDGTVVIVWPPTWPGRTSLAFFSTNHFVGSPRPFWDRLDCRKSLSRALPPTHWRPALTGPNGEKP